MFFACVADAKLTDSIDAFSFFLPLPFHTLSLLAKGENGEDGLVIFPVNDHRDFSNPSPLPSSTKTFLVTQQHGSDENALLLDAQPMESRTQLHYFRPIGCKYE